MMLDGVVAMIEVDSTFNVASSGVVTTPVSGVPILAMNLSTLHAASFTQNTSPADVTPINAPM